MQKEQLNVQMLGGFSLSFGEYRISCEDKRSPRVWTLLAYLLFFHERPVPAEELIRILWNDSSNNPTNALKTTLHRARALLDTLKPGAGHEMLLASKGSYCWNPEFPIKLDCQEMEWYVQQAEKNSEQQLEHLLSALKLYKGSFLGSQPSEIWSLPYSAFYQQLYMEVLSRTIPLLEESHRYEEAVELCRKALTHDPYSEMTYQFLMRNLMMLKQRKQVITVYEEMSKLLLSNFGVMPDQESRAIYREALNFLNQNSISPEILLEQLTEQTPISSALYCDFDFFKMLYQAQARALARSGDAVHTVLLSLKERPGRELSARSLELAMDNAQNCIAHSLRKGDVITRCSNNQFVIMLPQANYENSCMVCERIIKSFNRQYPHSPAELTYTVKPIEPELR